jgi:hypothetical protein
MRSRHQNVFFYYRGPTQRTAAGAAERQVEDNTTKALVNLLEYGGRELTRSFVQRFVSPDPPNGAWSYLLQRGPTLPDAPARFLLGLSASGTVPDVAPPAADAGSRVDGALFVPGSLLVALESKVGSADLEPQQFAAHAQRWDVDPASRVAARWIDVYRWARAEDGHEPVATFLLSQFAEYLELTGLSPYGGFRHDDFDALAGDEPVGRAQAKQRLAGIWEFVIDQLDRGETALLGELHSANLATGERRTSRQTNWADRGRAVNFTLELAAEPDRQLELDVVAWPKSVALSFERWLRSPDGANELADLDGYQLVLFVRRAAIGASGNPYWQQETHRHEWIVDAVAFDPAELDRRLTAVEPVWELPAFHLRRAWPEDVVVAQGEGIADELAGEIRRLLPLLPQMHRRGRSTLERRDDGASTRHR